VEAPRLTRCPFPSRRRAMDLELPTLGNFSRFFLPQIRVTPPRPSPRRAAAPEGPQVAVCVSGPTNRERPRPRPMDWQSRPTRLQPPALAQLLPPTLNVPRWTRASSTAPVHWSCCRKAGPAWPSSRCRRSWCMASRRPTASTTSMPAWSRSSSPRTAVCCGGPQAPLRLQVERAVGHVHQQASFATGVDARLHRANFQFSRP
jgi:hypothetical protein